MAAPVPLHANRGHGRTYTAAARRRSGQTSTHGGLTDGHLFAKSFFHRLNGRDPQRSLCRPLAFGVRSLDVRLGPAAITLCRNGRLLHPATCSRAFARRYQTDAGGPPALSRDGMAPRPPRELRIGRSLWAKLDGADLSDANLCGAEGLTQAQLALAHHNAGTRLP